MKLDQFDIARFWSRVEVRKREQCWPWRYGQNDEGYGEFKTEHGLYVAHRVAFTIRNGEIGRDWVVRHRCDNRACCNPDHLESGTHADNVQDRVDRGRSAIGEANGRSKLTAESVKHIRESILSNAALAREYSVDVSTIRQIRRGKTWAHE